jgi:hypothetical protein
MKPEMDPEVNNPLAVRMTRRMRQEAWASCQNQLLPMLENIFFYVTGVWLVI